MSDTPMILPKETAQALVDLTGEVRVEAALTRIIREYARQRLTELEAEMRRFENKYGMTFEAYRRLWETEDRSEHYTFEAEDDYLVWEGVATRRKRLIDRFAWLP
ncbi:MAG: hypothetical protein ACOYYU_14290 [Chloroflexota bacterium]